LGSAAQWKDGLEPAKDELMLVIRTISEFEAVWLLTPASAVTEARRRFKGCNVEIIETPVIGTRPMRTVLFAANIWRSM
jgi:agmatine/peptidylarginine deiminase